MRFFDVCNRWQVLAATLAIVLAIELGAYYFFYLPNRPSAPGDESGQQGATTSLEDTDPTTAPEATTSPPGEFRYRP